MVFISIPDQKNQRNAGRKSCPATFTGTPLFKSDLRAPHCSESFSEASALLPEVGKLSHRAFTRISSSVLVVPHKKVKKRLLKPGHCFWRLVQPTWLKHSCFTFPWADLSSLLLLILITRF